MNENELKTLENKLWASADKMRGAVSVSDYKFIVLGLIFLKYISDSFEERYKELKAEGHGFEEIKDFYTEKNIFYVPKNARWNYLVEHSKDSNIGEIIDEALSLIEKDNPNLKNVLPKDYNSPTMRNVNLGELIDLFTNIKVGTQDAIKQDVLGRIYEYFLGQFAKNELQKGGEFYTPACLVKTMVECIEPYQGRVYDPACGSGGMFIQSLKFVQEHQGNIMNVSIYGQEKNPTTWRLAKMNLAIRSLNGDLGNFAADTFTEDLHKNLKADFVLANPPFNMEWDRDKVEKDPRWKYGLAPKTNANYAWLQHMISKLSQNGKMACILANGSLSAGGQEAEIRKKLLDDDLVDCIITMPDQLFYTTPIPVSIWIIDRNKQNKYDTLFIDASNMGTMITRKLRELSNEEILKIAETYHNYQKKENYEDIKGFCKKSNLEKINANDYVLTPGRYVGTEEVENDGIPFEEKMKALTCELSKQMKEKNVAADVLSRAIKTALGKIGKVNVTLQQKFSDRFNKIVEAYNERTSIADIEKVIQELINLRNEITEEINNGNEFDLSIEEKAFFDALGDDPEIKELMKDDTLVQIAKELVDLINKNLTLDAFKREDARARIRVEIRRLLVKYDYPPNKSEDAIKKVIRQAELKYVSD